MKRDHTIYRARNEAVLVQSNEWQLSIDRRSNDPDIPPDILLRSQDDDTVFLHVTSRNADEFSRELKRLLWAVRVSDQKLEADSPSTTITQFAAFRCGKDYVRLMFLTADCLQHEFCLTHRECALLRDELVDTQWRDNARHQRRNMK